MKHRSTSHILGLLVSLGLGMFLGASPHAADIHVFAAASLSDVLKEIAPAYEESSGDKIRFNLAASSTLARQIQEGAPADIFFSADEEKMDDLEKQNLIETNTRTNRLSNTLVIVVEKDRGPVIKAPADLASDPIKRLALAETRSVPAGIYARKYLDGLGLWNKLSGKVIPTENVRGALAAVEAGNADAAIVYKTDALISKQVKIAHAVPAGEGPSIRYPIAAIKDAKNAAAARRFIQHLTAPETLRTFEKHGFLVR